MKLYRLFQANIIFSVIGRKGYNSEWSISQMNCGQNMERFWLRKLFPVHFINYYKKWLRYYLDYCHKYKQPYSARQSLEKFG